KERSLPLSQSARGPQTFNLAKTGKTQKISMQNTLEEEATGALRLRQRIQFARSRKKLQTSVGVPYPFEIRRLLLYTKESML
ncbi:hypothetical protein K0M31_005684, partial [Melipona bicolor]